MAWPGEMPEESYVRRMVEDMHQAVTSIEHMLLRGNDGEGGLLNEVSHVKRSAGDNHRDIKRLRDKVDKLANSVDMIARGRPDPEMGAKFWGKVTLVVAALGGIMELVTTLIGG